MCPLTIHALLHIADSIEAMGPVWCYWAFPMERYCGTLQPAIRSRCFPYASLDRYVVEDAQLTQIKVVYNVAQELALRPPRTGTGGFSDPLCMSPPFLNLLKTLIMGSPADPTCVLLPPKSPNRPTSNLINSIAVALATRFDVRIGTVKPFLNDALIEEWGKIRRVDSDEGDTMRTSSTGTTRDDSRDATYVRVRCFDLKIIYANSQIYCSMRCW